MIGIILLVIFCGIIAFNLMYYGTCDGRFALGMIAGFVFMFDIMLYN